MNPMNDNVHYQDLGIFLGYPKWQLSGPSCISSGAGLSLELHGPHFWVGPTPTLNKQKTIDIDTYMVTCNLICFWPQGFKKMAHSGQNCPLARPLHGSSRRPSFFIYIFERDPPRVFTTLHHTFLTASCKTNTEQLHKTRRTSQLQFNTVTILYGLIWIELKLATIVFKPTAAHIQY